MLKDYNGKVVHVYKHFPLTQMHPWAKKAALVSEAIYQLRPELFWEVHDYFFSSQKEINANNIDQQAESFVASKKINVEEFKKKLASPEVEKAVEADIKEAMTLGVNSTPMFFINGRKVGGALPANEFKKVIDEAFTDSAASR